MKTSVCLKVGSALALSLAGSVSFGQNYVQTNLDANVSGVAEATDANLVNSWGLSRASGGVWWNSNAGTGVATLFNGPGAVQSLVVTIPPATPGKNGAVVLGTPTGIMANSSTTDFLLGVEKPADFVFCTLDGILAAWNPTVGLAAGAAAPSTHAIIVAKGAKDSSYTGVTSALINGSRFLYVANFGLGRVDVYDNSFNLVKLSKNLFDQERLSPDAEPFQDEELPRGFVPFNVQTIGNDVVVTYALHQEGQKKETDGPGLGYVDIYKSTGQLKVRLQHGDQFNAPWGVTLAPLDWGSFSHDLLIGQNGGGGATQSAGTISAYDLATGKFVGLVQDPTGNTLAIEGLWGISFANASTVNSYDPDEAPSAEMYFTAGANGGTSGLFGYLTPVTTELVQGSDQ